jgi:CheY-like chemotaxis protein/anti-sigma regulatory factor (Ser/Thr protein kinase)
MTVSGDLTGPVLVDPRRMAQMVGNLIGNAVKFTDEGGVRVRASRPDKAVLRIEVEDDGPGLPEDMHDAVFERFIQADMSQARAHEGAGLGLAIVRELAQLAGGVTGVRSRPGEGACFWIELPAPAAARRPAAFTPAGSPDTMLRVLVVDDHPVNRAVTAELVTEAGHACETADTGEDALSALSARPIDLVLLDLHMPGLDGAEVLARIRRGEAGPADLPVVIVSADATPEARSKTLALGADGFVVKPVDAEALQSALVAAARKRSAG